MSYEGTLKRLRDFCGCSSDGKALKLLREKFQKLNDSEGDIGERLYVMLLHGRLLVVNSQF
jgi:hypothetical protein